MNSPPESPNQGNKKKPNNTHRRSASENISPRTNPASLNSMILTLNSNNSPASPTVEGNYTTRAPSTDQTAQATPSRRTPHRTQSVYLGPNGQSPTSLRQQPHERAVAEAQRQLHDQQGPFAPTPVDGGNNSYNVRPGGEQEGGTGSSGEGKEKGEGGEGGGGKGEAKEKEKEGKDKGNGKGNG
ncbi:hypothetical protein TI39_contig852g00015 [Zymoseptoria brevis]|uniref:Uncharacterized protein n=1 Tax=Zymoseptoria brevis TaxID=1047168 RepID=A0A0F4GEY7_9PEZI|nr:hypothetical protein TI39_contig852g00015 [Zymoseptoria brevis]